MKWDTGLLNPKSEPEKAVPDVIGAAEDHAGFSVARYAHVG